MVVQIQERKDFSTTQLGKLGENFFRYQCSKFGISYFQGEEGNSTDYVINIKGKLLKVQIKTNVIGIKNGYLKFNTCRKDKNGKRICYSNTEVDYYIFFDAINEKLYMIDYKNTPKYEITIRIQQSKNNQQKGIIYGNDHLFEDIIRKIQENI